jgi:hypothetical protein
MDGQMELLLATEWGRLMRLSFSTYLFAAVVSPTTKLSATPSNLLPSTTVSVAQVFWMSGT